MSACVEAAARLAIDLASEAPIPHWLLKFEGTTSDTSLWTFFSAEPLLVRVCRRVLWLQQCAASAAFHTLTQLCGQPGINEDEELSHRMRCTYETLNPFVLSWSVAVSDPERLAAASSLWQEMSGPEALGTLLLARRTKGSVALESMQIPSMDALIESFQELHAKRVATRPSREAHIAAAHPQASNAAAVDAGASHPAPRQPKPRKRKPSTTLTVGARAIAKHCGRSSSAWWGSGPGASSGPEPLRNAYALRKLREILTDVVWANFHVVPSAADSNISAVAAFSAAQGAATDTNTPPPAGGQATLTPPTSIPVSVLEVRCSSGHGARWYLPGGSAHHTPPAPSWATVRFWEQLRQRPSDMNRAILAGYAVDAAQWGVQAAMQRVRAAHVAGDTPPCTPSGVQFRGFLEPTGGAAGHASGWKS